MKARVLLVFAALAASVGSIGYEKGILTLDDIERQSAVGGSALGRYDFSGGPRSRLELAGKLSEISGLAVSADGRLFAHNDERAVIHEIDVGSGRIVKSFALGNPILRGDFEGLAIVAGRFYIATSDGVIYETREGRDGEHVPSQRWDTGVGMECEMEGLGHDPSARTLLLACKDCRRETACGSVTVFRWSIATRAMAKGSPLRFRLLDVARTLGTKSFHPSGIERDPRTGNYLILAANERAIIELSPQGKLVASVKLAKRWHPQSEGIAVMPDLTLIVSDEGKGNKQGRGSLSLYAARSRE